MSQLLDEKQLIQKHIKINLKIRSKSTLGKRAENVLGTHRNCKYCSITLHEGTTSQVTCTTAPIQSGISDPGAVRQDTQSTGESTTQAWLLRVLCASTSRVFAQLLYTEHCSAGPMDFSLYLAIFLVFFTTITSAGPAAYAACQAACAAGTVAAAHVAGPGAVAAYSTCQAACATSFLIPEPSCTIM